MKQIEQPGKIFLCFVEQSANPVLHTGAVLFLLQCGTLSLPASGLGHLPYLYPMLPFLSRLAFISNLFLIPVLLIHFFPSFGQWDPGLISHIVITAYCIALPVNLFVCSGLLLYWFRKKASGVPRWLRVANGLFLLVQIYYFQFM